MFFGLNKYFEEVYEKVCVQFFFIYFFVGGVEVYNLIGKGIILCFFDRCECVFIFL